MRTFFSFLISFHVLLLFSQEKKLTQKQIDSTNSVLASDKFFNEEGVAKATELYYRAKEMGYENGQIKSLFRLAELESGMSNFSKSMDHIAILKPLTLANDDYENYINALCIESKNFFSDKNYTQSLKILNQAKVYLPKINDLDKRRKMGTNISIYKYFTIDNSKSPKESYRDSLIAISKKMCAESFLLKDKKVKSNRLLFSSTWAATNLIELDRLTEANHYLKIGNDQLKIEGYNNYSTADYYEAKGDFEFKNKENNKNYLDSALSNYNKSLKICYSLGYRARLKTLYPKMATVYGAQQNLEKKMFFLEKDRALRDSLDRLSNSNLNDFKQKAYNPKAEVQENSFSTKRLLIFLLGAAVFAGIALFGYRKYVVKNENSDVNEIPLKKLTEHEVDSLSAKKLITLLYEDEKVFYLSFNEAYPDFSDKLLKINPTIKSSDVEFCALIKLNLETKQIANIKKMSVRAVEGKKYRIRKKLDITSEENMYLRIQKL